jgi:hypothetical protein
MQGKAGTERVFRTGWVMEVNMRSLPAGRQAPTRPLPERPFSSILEFMEVHFTPEQEARLAQIATNAGTDAERLVKDAVLRLLDSNFRNGSQAGPTNDDLPLWHLGGVGPLHRREIYDDAR